jgi:hypothetical protein
MRSRKEKKRNKTKRKGNKKKGREGGSDEDDSVKKHLYRGLLPPGANVSTLLVP